MTVAEPGTTTHVAGTLNSAPNLGYELDFYANSAPDPSGYGEGQRYLGSTTVLTDAAGNAAFDLSLPSATVATEWITATATDANGNTSEFSAVIAATHVFVVTNTSDSGTGSLRQAITDSNLNPGLDRIEFNIPVTDPGFVDVDSTLPDGDAARDVFVIKPLSALPNIASAGAGTIIDGRTQAGFGGDANPFGPEIVVDGSLAGSTVGLRIRSSNNQVYGLNIQQFAGAGIDFGNGVCNTVIAGNYIGTDATGTARKANTGYGIQVWGTGCNNNLFGSVSGDATLRNVISANLRIGLAFEGANSTGNVIAGNYIGTDATGNVAMGNGTVGVWCPGIKLSGSGGFNQISGNTIGANIGPGIAINTNNNLVTGNYVGTDRTGQLALGNVGEGIVIFGNAQSNQIGGSPQLANTIAFNSTSGVNVTGLTSNSIQANSIYSNGSLGVNLGASGVTANDPLDADTGSNNLQNFPVLLGARLGTQTLVAGALNSVPSATYTIDFYANSSVDPSGYGEGRRYLGSTTATTDSSGNATFNVSLASATTAGEWITATATDGAGNTSEFSAALAETPLYMVTNTLDAGPGTLRQAILDANAASTTTTIRFNMLATGPGFVDVDSALPDGDTAADAFVIRPVSPLPALSNMAAGIIIDGRTQASFGGDTNPFGPEIVLDGNLAGNTVGLRIRSSNNQVYGLNIQQFGNNGMDFGNGVCSTVIAGNYIGTDATGKIRRGNAGYGIQVWGTGCNNNLFGSVSGDATLRNVISANLRIGLAFEGSNSTGNIIAGNYIGTDATGTGAMGNGTVSLWNPGIKLSGSGGFNQISGNTIGANIGPGIAIRTNNNLVTGNYIGTDHTGQSALGNLWEGIVIFDTAQSNQIGGSPQLANTIAFNSTSGVNVTGLTSNSIQANSIYSNGSLGINLGASGVAANDALDADAGPNNLQNFPVWGAAEPGATTNVVGTLDSAPYATFTIDFYLNNTADASGYGQGQQWLCAITVTANELGHAAFDQVLSVATVKGQLLTATATDSGGNTSEFSAIVVVNSLPIARVGGPYTGTEGSPVGFDASGSSDPDGDLLQYRWDFNSDGTWETDWSSAATASYTWPDDFHGSVKVEVSDGVLTGTATTSVDVENTKPVIAAGSDQANAHVGTSVDVVASFTDQGTADTHTATVDWGDGTPVASAVVNETGGSGTASASHTYQSPGVYQAVVTVLDDNGGSASDALMVAVDSAVVYVQQGNPGVDLYLDGENLMVSQGGTAQDLGLLNSLRGLLIYGTSDVETFAVDTNGLTSAGVLPTGIWMFAGEGAEVAPMGDTLHLYDTDPENFITNYSYTTGGPENGTISMDSLVVHFSEFEPIRDGLRVLNRTFAIGTAGDSTIHLADAGSADPGMSVLDDGGSGRFESLVFTNPESSFAVTGGTANNTIVIEQLDNDWNANATLTVNGGVSDNVIEVLDTNRTVNINGGSGHNTVITRLGNPVTINEGDDFAIELTDVVSSLTGTSVDWGDGVTTTPTVWRPTHLFTRTGPCTVVVSEGGVPKATMDVTIRNVAPTVDLAGVPAASEGHLVTLTPSVADRGGAFDQLSFLWHVDSATNGQVIADSTDQTFSFTPNDEGSYTILLTVTDEDGAATSVEQTIQVSNVAPTASIVSISMPRQEGTIINVSGSATDPGALDTLGYAWAVYRNEAVETFATGNQQDFSFTPDDNGSYRIVLTVTDNDQASTSVGEVIQVSNLKPTASITWLSTQYQEGTAIEVSANATDPGTLDILNYEWAVYMIGVEEAFATGTQQDFSFTPDDNGNYRILLTVTDKDQAITVVEETIGVANVAPSPSIVSIGTPREEGTAIAVTGTATDPAGANDTLNYAWSVYQDGGTTAFASGTGASWSFTPTDNGSYEIRLTASDEDGGSSTVSQTIGVANVAPSPSIVSIGTPREEGTAIAVTGTATDPAGANDTLNYAWSVYQDGGTTAFASGTGASWSFTPTDNGSYEIRLTASDEDGGSSTVSQTIGVANVAPQNVVIVAPASGVEGMPITVTGSATDPGVNDTLTYSWVVFKGPETTAFAAASGVDVTTFIFTPNDNSDYRVQLTVSDEDGGTSATVEKTIVVPIAVRVVQDGVNVVVIGTNASDTIAVNAANPNAVTVMANGSILSGFYVVGAGGRVIVYGLDGDDNIAFSGNVSLEAHGGAGNDAITGGAGDDVIWGGGGNDTITGSAGNDVLLGGDGQDRIVGSAGHDILIAGDLSGLFNSSSTDADKYKPFDGKVYDYLLLRMISEDWAASRAAIADLANEDQLNEADIIDTCFDQLTGSSGADWFMIDNGDKITDLAKSLVKDGDKITMVI